MVFLAQNFHKRARYSKVIGFAIETETWREGLQATALTLFTGFLLTHRGTALAQITLTALRPNCHVC